MLLASPYHLSLDPAEAAAGKPFPPLGPLVSAAELRARGHAVAFYDATLLSPVDTFREALRGHRPTRVAIVSDPHSVPVKMCTLGQREAAISMVRLARDAGASVLVAGPDATDHPLLYVAAGATHVVLGEHDGALLDWAEARLDPGVAPRRANTTDLDALPDPAWDLVDLAAYAERWRRRHGRWELNVSTARGCPYRCNWCAKPTWGRSYHVAPPERVARQIATARERWRPDGLWFTDDIFAVKPSWLSTFRGLVGKDPLPFRCNTRADLVREGSYVADLAAAGCREVWMGAESGSDMVLSAMDKDQTRADIAMAVSRLRSAGIRVGFFLQLGYPGERYGDVLATLAMVRSLRPDEIGISVSYPLPGTAFHDRVRDQLKGENWASSMANEVLFAGAYPQPFYDAVREVLRAESAWWTWRPGRGRGALRRTGALPWHAARWPVHRARMRWFGKG
ncbi:MAG: B12-binding domain-containing radical SAM protein [Myxococcales bacterium]|nr:B12-binding domain-containing radical SAM protein [Myxococcales bacterium]